MDVVPHGGALAAMRAAIDRAIPIRLLTRPDAVGHLGDDRTAHRAVRAHVLAPRHGGAGRRWRAGFGLAHGTDRQASERSEAAREEARSAQEAAAIETNARFGRKRRPDRAAANLAMCSPDQHDRVPSLRGVAIDAVKRLHLGRVGPVASLALVREVARVRRIASACGYRGGANRQHAQEIAAPDAGVSAIFHGRFPRLAWPSTRLRGVGKTS